MSRLFISFSGGRTSAYMTWRLLQERQYDEIAVVFANSGQEHEKTLEFVNSCDMHMGFNTIWLEALVNPIHKKGTETIVTNFSQAARKGEPFEEMIKKYGIPNPSYRHCTRELKMSPMHWYVRNVLGWEKGSYDTAIGIRADEFDRMRSDAEKEKLVYPLVKWNIKKDYIKYFWRQQHFDLDLPEHLGNCVTCWKKSDRKLLTIAKQEPHRFDFFYTMENRYAFAGAGNESRVFFRRNRNVAELLKESTRFTDFFVDGMHEYQPELDLGDGCSESCEIYGE